MSLTDHCGAAVGAAHCASLSEVSRLSSRPRCAVSDPRTSTTGAWDIRMLPPGTAPRAGWRYSRASTRPVTSSRVLIAKTRPVTGRLQVREIDDDEGPRLVRIVRRGSGSVVTCRRAQMVLLSAQGM